MKNDVKELRYENIPLEIVISALNGNENGYEKILAYYEKYINKLCLKRVKSEFGDTEFYFVDEDKKQLLKIAIIRGVRDFAKILVKEAS